MPIARVYLPLTAAQLAELASRGELAGDRVRAYAVTPGLADSFPGADEEELEYAALRDASDAARALRGPGQTHRVIAAADVDAALLHVPDDAAGDVPSRQDVQGPVALRRVASFHVDEAPTDDADLLWYDVTEIDEVVRLSTA
jgi:hypothetical protein